LKTSFSGAAKAKNRCGRETFQDTIFLNRCELEGFEADFQVVDFRNVYGVPLDFLVDLSRRREKRLRLLPPYREHLSQAFARFFMRVGLPVDIDLFK